MFRPSACARPTRGIPKVTDAAVHGGHGSAQSVGARQEGAILLDIHVLLAKFVAAGRESKGGHGVRHQDDPARMSSMSNPQGRRMGVDPIRYDAVMDDPVLRDLAGRQKTYKTRIPVMELFWMV